MYIKRFIAIAVALCTLFKTEAQQSDILVNDRDTIRYTYTPLPTKPTQKRGWQKIVDYYQQSTTDNTDTKRFDVTVVGAPTYSSTVGLGLGVMAAGLYRIDKEYRSLPVRHCEESILLALRVLIFLRMIAIACYTDYLLPAILQISGA